MKCREVISLLDLSDSDARCDPDAIGQHLSACPACAARFPEVSMLVASDAVARAAPHPSTRARSRVAAGALVIVAALGATVISSLDRLRPAWAIDADSELSSRAVPSPKVDPPRVLATTVSHQTVVLDRGRRFQSRISHAVWTAPQPSCLHAERAGT